MKITANLLRRLIKEELSNVTDVSVNTRLMGEFSDDILSGAADDQTNKCMDEFRTKVLRMIAKELNRLGSVKNLNPMALGDDIFEDDDLLTSEMECATDITNALTKYASALAEAAAKVSDPAFKR